MTNTTQDFGDKNGKAVTDKPKDRVIIFDTTLRDGEQSPGFSMTIDEKVRMAKQLEALGVDVMEAGFPAASDGDFEAVKAIAESVENVTVAALCRAVPADIERAAEAIKNAKKPRIHTFIATSPIHMEHKLNKTENEVLDIIRESVSLAKKYVNDVEWSAEDASRSEIGFLCKAVETAIIYGATTINLPDTVGYAAPDEYADMFKEVIAYVRESDSIKQAGINPDDIIFSAHCHNDLGRAVDNSLAAVQAGVRQVECTVNGIGERAGNAALEQIAMNITVRPDIYPYKTNIAAKEIGNTSGLLHDITGIGVQPNCPIVGKNAFAHASGIHQDGMLKHNETYEIMTPESVGMGKTSLVIGKHSGRSAVADKLKQLGFKDVDGEKVTNIFAAVKSHADNHKTVEDKIITTIAEQHGCRLVA